MADVATERAIAAHALAGERTRKLARRLLPYAPALAASALLGTLAMRGILEAAGHPAVPLDDAFIHFQYAKRLAGGSFFGYAPGAGYTTGATSFLWPILLAPFYLVGLRDLSIIYVAWTLGTIAHAALAVETARVAERLAGRAAAVGAGALCIAFAAFAWFAWSGMETVALAWILMRSVRVASAFCERPVEASNDGAWRELIALGIAAPLVRPEGAIASAIAATALALRPPSRGRFPRAIALAPLAGPLVVPLLHLALAGHAVSSTAIVKWMIESPYHRGAELWNAVAANVALLVTSVLDGGDWTHLFVPEHTAVVLALAMVALAVAAVRRGAGHRAAFTFVVALGMLLPCTYSSFLWNRLRYVWPFAGAWFVMIACLANEIGELARRFERRAVFVTPLVIGAFVGVAGSHLPSALADLAESARAIDRQQVTLARWARENLPPEARIGVNDTGAIAYLGGHPTFDVVGLTTEGEAPYWTAGAGSRFEHYETMARERLPTHFIVYPHWMACEPVLGPMLAEATVVDQSILGGQTMVAFEARYDLLGSGARPAAPHTGALVDELDVADLASERAHDYALEDATDVDDVVDQVGDVADGGRLHRRLDRFVFHVNAAQDARIIARLGADEPTEVTFRSSAGRLGSAVVPAATWTEIEIAIPAAAIRATLPLEVSATSGRFASFHYWAYQD